MAFHIFALLNTKKQTMLKALYATKKAGETEKDFSVAVLDESIDLCLRLNEYIIKSSGMVMFSHMTLDEAGVKHRLTELNAEEAVELLADLADLRDELQNQLDMIGYRKRTEASGNH